jgi:hypothetical protein
MAAGIANMVWGVFKGIITGSILSDAYGFLKAIWEMASHPVLVAKAIGSELAKKWEEGWYARGKLIGALLVEVLIAILTFGTATAARVSGWVSKLWELLKTTKAGAMLAKVEAAAAKAAEAAEVVKGWYRKAGGKLASAGEAVVAKGKRAVGKVIGPQGMEIAAQVGMAVERFMARLRKMAEWVFEKFGFKRFETEVRGDYVYLYGIRSRILLARFRKHSLHEFHHDSRLAKALVRERARRLREARALEEAAATERNAQRAEELQEAANSIRGEATRQSELIGERAAMATIERRFAAEGVSIEYVGSGRNTLDIVFELEDGTVGILEAKGGKGRRITRQTGPGERAEQGTVAYLRSVLEDMKKAGGRQEEVARKVEKALKDGKLRSFYTETPIGGRGLKTRIEEFRLR